MAAFVELVVIDEFVIRPFCPTPRGLIELVRKDAHGSRDRHVLGVEIADLIFPIKTGRRHRRVRQPEERDVSCKASRVSVKGV